MGGQNTDNRFNINHKMSIWSYQRLKLILLSILTGCLPQNGI